MERERPRPRDWIAVIVVILFCMAFTLPGASMHEDIEADWWRQAQSWLPRPTPTQGDAAGAVDGIKNGKYGFHTAQEANPWWQVDLGETLTINRLVVFNRLDYAPGLHNADNLLILASLDGRQWRQVYHHQGHYGGVTGAPPLEIKWGDKVQARFVRLQIPSTQPIFFHLDEVEIYGAEDANRNLAWQHPADQSSVSTWSTMKNVGGDVSGPALIAVIHYFIERGRLLAAELQRQGVDIASTEREWAEAAALARQFIEKTDAQELRPIYYRVRWTLRRLVFRHPLLNFKQLLVVKRFCQETYPDVCLNHMPWVSRPGGDLSLLTLTGPETAPLTRNLIHQQLGPGHVHGMDLSWDARRIVFGYAKAKSNEPPTGWLDRTQSYRLRRTEEPIHIYEMGVNGQGLRQLTEGEWSDLDPTYAPNNDIVFVSERCATSLQCNEYDKDETSCNLYVMHPDGSGIRRLSANKDGDYLPHTLDDGTIGYTRWEYHERSWAYIQSLWTIRPDGTQAEAIFKQHFVNPWALEDVRSVPGTSNSKLVCVAAGHHTLPAGPVVVVTPGIGINDPRGISIVTPGVQPPEGGMDGVRVPEGGVRDQGGYYMHPWPLSEKTFLVSYTYGTGKSGTTSEIDPAGYAVYLIDVFGTKELLYRDPAISCFMPMPLRSRARPPLLPDLTLATTQYATCLVSTVSYGCEGIAPERVRYLRIAEPVGWPYDNERGGQRYGEDHRYGGPGAERKNLVSWTPIHILGDVPVERDGSAHFRVPADKAVYFQLLDERRMELRRMRSFISFQPGEQRACTGCHESRTVAPVPAKHTVSLAMMREASELVPPPWGDRPVNFLRDIQPVLDQHCVRCHSGLRPAGGIDLCGGLTAYDTEVAGYGHNRAYETILEKGLVSISAVRAQDASITPPLAYGSHQSKLLTCLTNAAHHEVKLSETDHLILAMWIDANAPYHEGFVNKRPAKAAYDIASDRVLLGRITAVHERRCAPCHQTAAISRLDWINIRYPRQSLFLAAPLASEAGGKAQCRNVIYRDAADRDYRVLSETVQAAVSKQWENPRRDLTSFGR